MDLLQTVLNKQISRPIHKIFILENHIIRVLMKKH
jgi:hypothetical protein